MAFVQTIGSGAGGGAAAVDPFLPLSIPGNRVFYHATLSETMPGASFPHISYLQDMGPEQTNGSQATALRQPTLLTNDPAVNNQNSIRFDRSVSNTKSLQNIGNTLLTSINACTATMVINSLGTVGGEYPFFFAETGNFFGKFCGFSTSGGNPGEIRFIFRDDSGSTDQQFSGVLNPAQYYVITGVKDALLHSIYVNGVLVGQASATATTLNAVTTTNFLGGAHPTSGASTLDCSIAAAAFYNVALTDTERQSLERNWGSEFGITVA